MIRSTIETLILLMRVGEWKSQAVMLFCGCGEVLQMSFYALIFAEYENARRCALTENIKKKKHCCETSANHCRITIDAIHYFVLGQIIL